MSQPKPLGIALVGPGTISEYHLNGLAVTGRTVLKAIVGRRLETARALAERFPAESVSDDLNAILSRDDVDALVVTTPDHTHESIAGAALTAGKHVLLQKPMSNSYASCRRIMDAADRSAASLQVSFMHRYFEEVCAAQTLLASGAIGTVTSARMRNATPGPDWGGWFFDPAFVRSGVVAQLGIHGIDLLTHLLGPVTHVSARLDTLVPHRRLADGGTVEVKNPDTALATYRMANGIVASHEMSMVEVAGCDRFRLEIYGTQGTLWLRSERGALAIANEHGEWSTPPLGEPAFGRRHHDRWLDGLDGSLPAEHTAADAVAGMQILESIERSAAAQSVEVSVEDSQ
ncbi:MAG: Gfo/Idh/MocA family oxidoreductase [Chromatiales bacterium]|jgi:predicted dehydrogenase|nr:Gfo/Idh/MocA family oxidoreductase [Chromatiales bacterium]